MRRGRRRVVLLVTRVAGRGPGDRRRRSPAPGAARARSLAPAAAPALRSLYAHVVINRRAKECSFLHSQDQQQHAVEAGPSHGPHYEQEINDVNISYPASITHTIISVLQ